MRTYVKTLEKVQAQKWLGHMFTPMPEVTMYPHGIAGNESIVCRICGSTEEHGWLETNNGGIRVCPGDWILRGQDNRLRVLTHDAFEFHYEPAVEDEQP